MTRQLHLTWTALRPRPAVPGRTVWDPSTTRLRVHPGDLDLYRHVNNGVYLQYMDIARTNLLADLGALGPLAERGWYAVVAASTVKYRRSLTWPQAFTVTSRVLGWDSRVVFLEQVFTRGDDLVARGLVAGRFLARSGERLSAHDVVVLLAGEEVVAPPLPADVAAWARAVDVAAR
jgi:YbgC/YbaW family acyl-CoA thioester hydrolase